MFNNYLNIATNADFDDDYLNMIMKYSNRTNEKLNEIGSSRLVTTKINPFPFNCQIDLSSLLTNNNRPTSVHSLRPSDIEVIGAIGDSLTVLIISIYHKLILVIYSILIDIRQQMELKQFHF